MNQLIQRIDKYQLHLHALFIFLGFFAFYYNEERLLADSGYYLFKVVNHESFWIEHDRFILLFSQLLPWIGLKLGLSLKLIIILYSIGHVLFFYLLFLIARYHYLNREAGIAFLLIQTVGISSGFFVPMFELYYAAGFLILFSVIYFSEFKKIDLLILVILAFFILTAHLYGVILFVIIIAIHGYHFRLRFIKYEILFVLMLLVALVYKSYTVTPYEQMKTNAFIETLKNADYDWNYFTSLFSFLWLNYKPMLVLLVLTISGLIYTKKYIFTLFTVLTFLVLLSIINISYYGFETSRYQEQVYFPLCFLLVYIFVFYVLNTMQAIVKNLLYVLLLLIFSSGLYSIYLQSDLLSNRQLEMKNLISQAKKSPSTKFMVNESNLKYDPNWSYSIETMFLSSIEKDKRTISICTNDDMNFEENRSKIKEIDYLFRRWEIEAIQTLNKNYFNLSDEHYQQLEFDQ